MRVRWALEELGLAYDERLLSFAELKQPEHLAHNPFGQIPTLEEDGLTLFESGAIVFYLASKHHGLLPSDEHRRARAVMWMFAALNTVEPPVFERSMALMLESKQPWHETRLAMLNERVRARLGQLSAHLGEAEWLDGEFSAGDLLTASVLMRLDGSELLAEQAALTAYLERAKARPAFGRAFAAQYAVFERSLSS